MADFTPERHRVEAERVARFVVRELPHLNQRSESASTWLETRQFVRHVRCSVGEDLTELSSKAVGLVFLMTLGD